MCQSLGHAQPCDPVHCSPPGSSAHGIFQARILEQVTISFSNSGLVRTDKLKMLKKKEGEKKEQRSSEGQR